MLKRVLLWTLGLTIAAFIAFFIYIAYFLTWNFDGSGSSEARREAESWLADEVSQFDCLTPDDLRSIALKRDWLVETHDTFHWCISRDDLSGWMSVTVEPALLMSTDDENRRYFGFDAQGCSAKWTYGGC